MKKISLFYVLYLLFTLVSGSFSSLYASEVQLGVDVFFADGHVEKIEGKKIGIITNHTGVDKNLCKTVDRFCQSAKNYTVHSLFSPEHGIDGNAYAAENVKCSKYNAIPIYSLHGKTRRPTKEMLKDIDVLIFDIQDIGTRSYTYSTTLFYVMEEAKKYNIEVIVLDRPNPLSGVIVDGPMLEEEYRSFLGYINVAYCHGMTIGELASYFNAEYSVGCNLTVVPMKGWNREMSFKDTGLHWIPTSPNIPEADTPYYYPSTGILGELKILSIGIGYTLPFKIVGAPWLDGKEFAKKLNSQKLPGVKFIPFYFRPFFGLYKDENCQGVKIVVTDNVKYKPVAVQYLILGLLKSLYPKIFLEKIEISKLSKDLFNKVNGSADIYNILVNEPYPAWKLIKHKEEERSSFLLRREKYLMKQYSSK